MLAHPLPASSWRHDILVALAFLTRLPMPPGAPLPANGLAQAMRAFPVAGAVVGLLAGLVHWGAALILPPFLAAVLAVVALVLLTGGLHEDGLADCADGLGARGGRLRRLEVMRDSRIGSYGVLALLLMTAWRVGALAALPPGPAAIGVLVAAGALSRAAMPLTMRLLPPARADGLGFSAGKPGTGTVLWAVLLGLAASLLGFGLGGGVLALLAALLATAWVAGRARRSLGGFTGDVLGGLQQVVEAAVLLVAVAAR